MEIKGKPLIIVSHPRSGSHFLINSIRQNADNLFGVQKPFFALDSLLVPGDKSVAENFYKWFTETVALNKTPVIEAKCLKEDCEAFVKKMPESRLDVKIIKHILKEGIFINLIRDPRESLLSWYKLSKSGGAMAFSASKVRLSNLNFKDFFELPNIHKLTYRDFNDYDTSTIKFCAYHHFSWRKNLGDKGLFVYYRELNGDFQNTIKKVFDFLKKNFNYNKWPANYVRPPDASRSRYYRKFGKLIKRFEKIFYSNFFKQIFKKFFNFELENLKKTIDSAFLSSQLPLIDKNYKPEKETNDLIIKLYNEAYKEYSGDLQKYFE